MNDYDSVELTVIQDHQGHITPWSACEGTSILCYIDTS